MWSKFKPLQIVKALLLSLSLIGCRSAAVSPKEKNELEHKQDRREVAQAAAPEKQETLTQEEIARAAVKSGYKIYRGQYANYEYGYIILIPKGFIGISDPSPQPQHGFRITLSEQPKAFIWVDGSYNTLLWKSLDDAVNYRLDSLKKDGTEFEVLKRELTTLESLPAMWVTARYRSHTSHEIMREDLLIAIRSEKVKDEEDEIEIVYTVGLRTLEKRYSMDKEVLEQVVNAWSAKPLGR